MSVLAALSKRWVQISILSALLCLSWVRGNHYQESRDLWREASKKQEQAYISAQNAATLALEAQRAKQLADYTEAKRHADEQAKNLSDDYQRSLSAYIGRMRTQGDRRAPGGSATTDQDQAARGVEADDAKAGLVGVSEHDLGLMVQAVADIEAARAWAAALVKAGLAE